MRIHKCLGIYRNNKLISALHLGEGVDSLGWVNIDDDTTIEIITEEEYSHFYNQNHKPAEYSNAVSTQKHFSADINIIQQA